MSNKLNGKPGVNQNVNNKAQQQGKNSLNTAANNPKKFDGNNDAKTINTILKKHVNDIDLSNDEDFETSESDCEVEDKINKNEKVKMQISNEASESEAEVDASSSEEEDAESVNSNPIKTSSEEVQQHNDRDDENQNAVSCIEDSNASNERDARTVCVRKLPVSIKEIHLRQFFSRYGKIVEISVEVTSMPHKKQAVADILFEHEEDAEKSLEARGMIYKGNYLVIYKRNHRLKNEDDAYAVCVSWKKCENVDGSLLLREMESFGCVKYLHFVQSSSAFVYFESVDSVELALAAFRITIGTLILYIRRVFKRGFKKRMQHTQHQEYHDINKKRLAKQPMHHKQYQTNLEPSIRIHKNKFDDSVTISFNKSGYQGSQFNQKKYKVRSGFVQKRR